MTGFVKTLSTAFLAITLLVANQVAFAEKPIATFTITGGEKISCDVPVSADITGLKLPDNYFLVELLEAAIAEVPTQIETKDGKTLLWWIASGDTYPKENRKFAIWTDRPEQYQAIWVDRTKDFGYIEVAWDSEAIDVSRTGKKILRYRHAIQQPPKGADPLYARGAFIHPLWSPSGEVLTAASPPDHLHHLGLWGPWTKTEFEGRHIDFWNLKSGEGTVRFKKILSKTSGPVFGEFVALQEHVDLKAPGGEKVALNEELTVRVWNLGGDEKYLVDYTKGMRCATNSPFYIKDYRYAGFGFRGRTGWDEDNSNYLTDGGKDRTNGDGTRARWCDVFGDTPSGLVGVLFMSHPTNMSYPEPTRIWPSGSNGKRDNVFFNFSPTKGFDWTLEPGKDYALKYRIYGHDGKLSAERAESLWQGFGQPPTVKMERK